MTFLYSFTLISCCGVLFSFTGGAGAFFVEGVGDAGGVDASTSEESVFCNEALCLTSAR